MNENYKNYISGRDFYRDLTVNYHLTKACNMGCKFCFARYAELSLKGLWPSTKRNRDLRVVDEIGRAGVRKITFVGGEPTLCPWLSLLIQKAKMLGMVTMLVTNGSYLTEEWLRLMRDSLDWVALSIDSLSPKTNLASGRVHRRKNPPGEPYYRSLVEMIRSAGYPLKINTTVSRYNYKEDMGDFISWASPEKWKIFQVLPIDGQNDTHRDEFIIDSYQYNSFLERHSKVMKVVPSFPEDNDAMTGSYVMIDPSGCFYDNVDGAHRRGEPVWEVGFEKAFAQIRFSRSKFVGRGGVYTKR